MRIRRGLYLVAGAFLIVGVYFSAIAQTPLPTFPYCTNVVDNCQVKVAQVPLPWQFWAVVIDPVSSQSNVVDRIRISPTWLNPTIGPTGVGPVFIQRQVARIPANPGSVPTLEDLTWDSEAGGPSVLRTSDWQMVDPHPVQVEIGQDLEYVFEDTEGDTAVLVAYEVSQGLQGLREVTGHFINMAVLESQSPQSIVQVMVNLDIHNGTGFNVTNFELDFFGLDFTCADINWALGFVKSTGAPWGANPGYPLVVRPIPGGTEVKWIQPDTPLPFSSVLHIGLAFSLNQLIQGVNATVQGYWTTSKPKVCNPQTPGYWKRICDGVTGDKSLHPETPAGFDTSLCAALQVRGKQRRDPCVRAQAQLAALLLNTTYGNLSDCCTVVTPEGDIITVAEAVQEVQNLIAAGECKAAADLADSINSGVALIDP